MTDLTAPTPLPPRSGKDIRAYRLNHGITLADLAEKIDISKPTLLKAETGGHIWIKSRKAIADYFNGLPEFKHVEITVTSIWPELMGDEAA